MEFCCWWVGVSGPGHGAGGTGTWPALLGIVFAVSPFLGEGSGPTPVCSAEVPGPEVSPPVLQTTARGGKQVATLHASLGAAEPEARPLT